MTRTAAEKQNGLHRLVDFSVAECVKHFDWWENVVFSPDFIESDGEFAS